MATFSEAVFVGVLGREYGYSQRQARMLLRLLRRCARYGAITGVGLGLSAGSGTIELGPVAVPAFVIGALAGFGTGTMFCTGMRYGSAREIREQLDAILEAEGEGDADP